MAKLINARLKGKKPEEEYMQMICYTMISDREAIMTETSFRYNKRKKITTKRYEEWAKGL